MSSCESHGGSEPLAHDGRCYAYCKTGRYEPPIRDCTRAIEREPKPVMGCSKRAQAYEATRMQDLARLDVEEASEPGREPACDRLKEDRICMWGNPVESQSPRQPEELLTETEEHLRDVLEHLLVGVSIVQDGRVVYRNPEQRRLLGRLPYLFAPESSEHIHPDDAEKVSLFHRRITSGEVRTLDTDFRFYPSDPAGQTSDMKWVHCRATWFEFRGKEAILYNLMDLTEAKSMERLLLLQGKMESLGRVAAGIAHEIRNPLSGINIYLNTLEKIVDRGGDPEKIRKIVEEAKTASNRIEAVIRRVMDFSRPGEPKTVLTDVNTCIEEAVKLSEVILRKRSIRLDRSLQPGLPHCRVDPLMIAQVVLNLITNAADAMKGIQAGARIEIGSRAQDGRIHVIVADSGPGVPEGERDKIFDPFFSTKDGSAGIGLSICQRIVKDHGGTLDVTDSKWGGAEFVFTIPVDRK
jgi:PAS domain S-box-containing protein